jgi:heat-inducible transcriptional repressor
MSQPAVIGNRSVSDPALSARLCEVFSALVEVHRESAHPVGAETLAHRAGLRLSPASVRHALAELEGLGLLEQRHASAGRVPTPRGVDLYVRTLLAPALLPPGLVAEIERTLSRSTRDIQELLSEASRLLSTLTHQLGLAVASVLDDEPVRELELAALDPRRSLLVLNLGDGHVRTLALELEGPLRPEEVAEVAEVLRERLAGLPLAEVRARLATDADLARDSAVRVVARAAMAGWTRPVSTPLYASGAMHMAELPEFADAARLGSVLRSVESGAPLDRLMVRTVEGQAAVRAGVDEDRALAACSLVSYSLPGSVRAAVGVLGPLRMDYARTLAVVDAVGSRVADLL